MDIVWILLVINCLALIAMVVVNALAVNRWRDALRRWKASLDDWKADIDDITELVTELGEIASACEPATKVKIQAAIGRWVRSGIVRLDGKEPVGVDAREARLGEQP